MLLSSSRKTRKLRGVQAVDARYAVINADGEIVNVIAWDGKRPYTPPNGHTLELIKPDETDTKWIGATVRPTDKTER